MTHFYLWYFPDVGEAKIKSIGLANVTKSYIKHGYESHHAFIERAKKEFDLFFEQIKLQVAEEFREGWIIDTKTLQ